MSCKGTNLYTVYYTLYIRSISLERGKYEGIETQLVDNPEINSFYICKENYDGVLTVLNRLMEGGVLCSVLHEIMDLLSWRKYADKRLSTIYIYNINPSLLFVSAVCLPCKEYFLRLFIFCREICRN